MGVGAMLLCVDVCEISPVGTVNLCVASVDASDADLVRSCIGSAACGTSGGGIVIRGGIGTVSFLKAFGAMEYKAHLCLLLNT